MQARMSYPILRKWKRSLHTCVQDVDRWRDLPNNHLQDQAKNLNVTPRVHLNSNVGKLSRLMVATRKYGEKV
jgi:hypothetical protein